MRPSALRILFCVAILAVPTCMFADQFCTDLPPYQYQPCGTVAATNVFTVNALGVGAGVGFLFRDYHANFADDIYARVFRDGSLVYTGDPTPTNLDSKMYMRTVLVPANELQAGDQIEFVLQVADVNGPQTYYSRAEDFGLNADGLNHTWATNLPSQGFCAFINPEPCVFVGFEDLPQQEGSDFDYNDFRGWLYGVTFTTQGVNTPSVPEPSSLMLVTGVPLAFALNKLRRLF